MADGVGAAAAPVTKQAVLDDLYAHRTRVVARLRAQLQDLEDLQTGGEADAEALAAITVALADLYALMECNNTLLKQAITVALADLYAGLDEVDRALEVIHSQQYQL